MQRYSAEKAMTGSTTCGGAVRRGCRFFIEQSSGPIEFDGLGLKPSRPCSAAADDQREISLSRINPHEQDDPP